MKYTYFSICSACGLGGFGGGLWVGMFDEHRSADSPVELMALGVFCLFSALLLGTFTEPRCTLGRELLEDLWALLLWSSWGRFSVISRMDVESKWISPPRCLAPGICGFMSLSALEGSLWIWRQSSMFCLSSEVVLSDGHWYCVGLDLDTLYLESVQRVLLWFYKRMNQILSGKSEGAVVLFVAGVWTYTVL